ncbi:MAG: transposase [Thermodesulfobacteriota bacterium]|nr:transposase [Thermodesulfobacteriota bacterium]
MFVQQRTSQILSFQSMITRNLGLKITTNKIKQMTEEQIEQMFEPDLAFMAKNYLQTINSLSRSIKDIEGRAVSQTRLRKEFALLQTIQCR